MGWNDRISNKMQEKGIFCPIMKEKKELIQYTAVCVFILCLIFHYWDTAASWLLAFLHVINPLLVGCAMA